ncbi:alpha/beta hydrolase [Thalassobacillus devorans]|uniref:alpha/beta hydrolase n=1 Tax=Thalassobacillus devorans TaxID=279813 RepID=UPI00048B4906|nr:alpha/beta hydrolase [Thalassobacillus devorans]
MPPQNNSIEHILQRLSAWEKPFSFDHPTVITPEIAAYLNYYELYISDGAFHFGKIETNGTKTMVQMFAPNQSKGTIFLLHGYLDHVGHLNHVIQFLNKHGYTVISYDLEGHGLSEGKTASVQRFSDYVHSLEKLMDLTKKEMQGPYYVIGHSTGGAIAIDYVLKHHDHVFDKVILAAPLVHSSHWYGTVLGYYIASMIPFLDKVKRNFRVNSSNTQYLKARKLDPLQTSVIPLDWVGAMLHWNKLLDQYPPSNTPTFVIQGNKDNTVAWPYNLKFIENKFTNSKMVQIDNSRHALFNESKEIRELVFSFIKKFIEEK